MNQKLEAVLEKLIINKLYIILLSIAFGIGVRFKYFEVTNSICFISIFILFLIYLITYKSYNKSLIKNDLSIIAGEVIDKNSQIIVNIYLSIIISITIAICFVIGFTAASLRFEFMIPKERLIKRMDDIYIIGRVSQLEIVDNGVRIYLDDVYESNRFRDIGDKVKIGTIRLNIRYNLIFFNYFRIIIAYLTFIFVKIIYGSIFNKLKINLFLV